MAIYRKVAMSFWTDASVVDDYDAEEKYMYLYLLTNPHTNLAGCYEISMNQIAVETGYSSQKARGLIAKLENDLDVIRYSKETKEVLILNWYKYNWTKSEKFMVPLLEDIKNVKNVEFSTFLTELVNGNDTVSIPLREGIDICARTVTVSVTDTVSVSDTDSDSNSDSNNNNELDNSTKESIKEIIDYFNEVTGKHYTYTGKDTVKNIKARLKENFTVDDFKTVIWKKTKQWLRPSTLFGNKFESYLNQSTPMGKRDELDEWVNAGTGGLEDIVIADGEGNDG